jgi:hypothetical protein
MSDKPEQPEFLKLVAIRYKEGSTPQRSELYINAAHILSIAFVGARAELCIGMGCFIIENEDSLEELRRFLATTSLGVKVYEDAN